MNPPDLGNTSKVMTSGKGKKDNNFSLEDWVVKKIYGKREEFRD